MNFAGEEAREASKAVFNDPRKNGCRWFYGTKRKLARRMLGERGGATCCPHNGISFILCTPDLTITVEG